MTEESKSSLNLPLVGGALIALLFAAGYTKVRLDRIERLVGEPQENASARSFEEPELERVDETPRVNFQEVYVPLDSVVVTPSGTLVPLTSTLTLRNTSDRDPLYVRSVELFDETGKRVRRITRETFEIAPSAQVRFLAQAKDPKPKEVSTKMKKRDEPPLSHFVVEWGSRSGASEPLIETVMVDDRGRLSHFRGAMAMVKKTQPAPVASHELVPPTPPLPESPRFARREEPSSPPYEMVHYRTDSGLTPKNP